MTLLKFALSFFGTQLDTVCMYMQLNKLPKSKSKFKVKGVFFCSCVQKDKCQTNTLGIRNFNQDGALDGLLEGLLAFKAEDASCPDIDMVCCNDLDVKTPGTTNLDVCTDFEKDGYRFVDKFFTDLTKLEHQDK